MESDTSQDQKQNQKKIANKWITRCCLMGWCLASVQHFISISATQTTLNAFAESLTYGIGMGLIYAIPLWVIWKVLSNFFPSLKK